MSALSDKEALEQCKKDHQDFIYTVSHDFAAPIRHIEQFTDILLDSIDGDLNDDQATYVEYIKKSIQKIHDMQEAMLVLSRLSSDSRSIEDIQMNEVMTNIVQGLHDGDVVKFDDLPNIQGEPTRIERLFLEVIKNALQYHAEGAEKEVSISAKSEGDDIVFMITDNGIGFDPEFKDSVFKMFRRLHGPEAYGGGLGVGLSYAQKIVERHEGDIQASSEIGRGSTVIIRLPQK